MATENSRLEHDQALKYHRHGTWDMIDVPVSVRSTISRNNSDTIRLRTAIHSPATQLLFQPKLPVRHPAISEVCSKFESLSKNPISDTSGETVSVKLPVVRSKRSQNYLDSRQDDLPLEPVNAAAAAPVSIHKSLSPKELEPVAAAEALPEGIGLDPEVITIENDVELQIFADSDALERASSGESIDSLLANSDAAEDYGGSIYGESAGRTNSELFRIQEEAESNECSNTEARIYSRRSSDNIEAEPFDQFDGADGPALVVPLSPSFKSSDTEKNLSLELNNIPVIAPAASEKSIDIVEPRPVSFDEMLPDTVERLEPSATASDNNFEFQDSVGFNFSEQRSFGERITGLQAAPTISEIFRMQAEADTSDFSDSSDLHSRHSSRNSAPSGAATNPSQKSVHDPDDAILNEALRSLSLNFESDSESDTVQDIRKAGRDSSTKSTNSRNVRFGGESIHEASQPEPRLDMFEYPLIKHGRRGRRRRIYLTVDLGAGIIRWGNGRRWLQIEHVLQVRTGKQTAVLKRRSAEDVDGRLCLSLITRDRSLDLECKTVEERKTVQLTVMNQIIGYLRHHNVRAGWVRPKLQSS